MENLKKLAFALYENYDKINYFVFLENITTNHNKALVEAVTKGFLAIYENELDSEDEEVAPVTTDDKGNVSGNVSPEFKYLVEISKKLDTLVAEIGSGKLTKITEQMMEVIKNHKGKVTVTPVQQFKDFDIISSYGYDPEGESTEEDVRNAKSVLASTVFKRIVYTAVQIGRRDMYKDAAFDFIANALEALPKTLDKFEFRGSSFLTAFEFVIKGLRNQAIADAQDTQMQAWVWSNKRDWPKGIVVNHNGKNYKAIQDAPKEFEPGKDNNTHWERFEKLGDKTSFDASVSKSGDEDDSISVGDTIEGKQDTALDAENKVALEKMLNKLPNTPEYNRYKEVLTDYFFDGKTATEIANKWKLDETTGKPVSRDPKDETAPISSQSIQNWILAALKEIRKANGLRSPNRKEVVKDYY